MGDVYGQYSTWICDDILFHSVPYLKSGDKSSLEYWHMINWDKEFLWDV